MIFYKCVGNYVESTHDEVVSLPSQKPGLPEYYGREVTYMTVFETIMVVLGVIGLLISLGMLVIALLNFLDKRNNKRK